MNIFYKICVILIIIGGINWGLIGLFSFDAVAWLLGDGAQLVDEALNGTGKTRLYPEAYRLGRAGGVCRAALAAGETVPAAQLIPDYHRLSQAERERAARLQAAP